MKTNDVPRNKTLKAAAKKLKSAVPASGFTPQTTNEWNKAQEALIKSGYSMFRYLGSAKEESQALANAIYGGQNGLALLEAALKESNHVE